MLRASTGELVWTFRTVHHDLWDDDVPMQPILFALEREGRAVPAVAVGTKSGHLEVSRSHRICSGVRLELA